MSYHAIRSYHLSTDQLSSRRPVREPSVMVGGESNPRLMAPHYSFPAVPSQDRMIGWLRTRANRGECSMLPDCRQS